MGNHKHRRHLYIVLVTVAILLGACCPVSHASSLENIPHGIPAVSGIWRQVREEGLRRRR
jgi:hypothetical protein